MHAQLAGVGAEIGDLPQPPRLPRPRFGARRLGTRGCQGRFETPAQSVEIVQRLAKTRHRYTPLCDAAINGAMQYGPCASRVKSAFAGSVDLIAPGETDENEHLFDVATFRAQLARPHIICVVVDILRALRDRASSQQLTISQSLKRSDAVGRRPTLAAGELLNGKQAGCHPHSTRSTAAPSGQERLDCHRGRAVARHVSWNAWAELNRNI